MKTTPYVPDETILVRDRDFLAAVASILPGAGQIYKGHYLSGFALLLLGTPMAIWVGLLLSLATFGVGLIVPLLFGVGVGTDAYFKRDLRAGHHWKGLV
jgi:hypothetical protein